MNTLTSESSLLIHSLGWSLLHSLWQGALIGLCLWMVLKVVKDYSGARARYHLLLSAQLVLGGWFVLTWIQQWQQLRSLTVVVTEASRDAGTGKTYTIEALPQQSAANELLYQWLPDTGTIMPWLVGFYIVGLCCMLLRFGIGLNSLFRIRYRGISQPDHSTGALFQRLKDRMGITLPVKLQYSARVTMPMMLGALKPVILLPVATVAQLSVAELEAILLHELAHIKRQDYLINIVQIFIETLLFFNPFVWWISAGIRCEREHCCDDLVIAQTQEPLPYAKALAALEANRYASQPFALAAAGQKHHLFNRIKRITEMKKTPLSYGRLAAALITAGGLMFSIVWFTPAMAQQRKDRKAAQKPAVQRIVVVDEQGNKQEYDMNNLPEEEQQKLKSMLQSVDATLTKKTEPANKKRVDVIHEEEEEATEEMAAADVDESLPVMPPLPPMPAMPPVAPMAALPPLPPMPAMPPMPPMPDISDEVMNGINAIDWAAIRKETRAALNEARRESRKAMKEINWKEIRKQMNEAHVELDRARRQVDWKKVNEQMKAANEQMLAANRQLQASMITANSARQTANRERGANDRVQEGLKQLEKDGLINRAQGYSLEKKNDRLYINGKKQDDDVADKYEKYFRNKKISISGSTNSQSVTIED
jgi:bla regulator protein BlaR1